MTKSELMDAVKNFLEREQLKYTVSEDENGTDIRVFIGQKEIRFSFYPSLVTISTYFDVAEFKFVTLSRMHLFYKELEGVRVRDNTLYINMVRSTSFLTVHLGQNN